jgi:adenosylmethionine-8-amino-7-oxononanoate aminotransferase
LVDPRDRLSFLPPELDAAHLVEAMALRHGLLVRGTQSTADGYAGDEILLAPAFTSSDEELSAMVERFAATIAGVEPSVTESLAAARAGV